jgi:adenylate cyclase
VSPIVTGIVTRASSFLGELKRRQVIQVSVVYAIVGAGVAEAADVFLGNLAPQWVLDVVLVLVLLGFPVAIVLAWAYDLTSRGIVRDLGAPTQHPRAEARADDPPKVSADPRAIAVLPFQNLSNDPENEYFADGVTDDIVTALTLVEGLQVTSRTSVMRYKGSDEGTRVIAAELGVGTVLIGSVRRSAGRVRVTVQLVDARSDGQMWAANYDRDMEDVFAVQSDIAENVARALSSRLSPRGRMRLKAPPTRNLEAYELLARARHAYLQVTQAHIDHGMALIRRALELDPNYGEAWAHLAIAHFVLPYFSKVSPASVERSAREAIDRAFALDDGLPEAHVARAIWRFNFRYDWEGAERDFETALVLNPSSADAYQWRGLMHLLCRHKEKAIADGRKSVALDPLSFQTRSQLGQNLIWTGELEAARPIVEEIVEEDPTNTIAHWSLGVLVRETDPEQALRHFDEALRYMDVPLAHASRSLVLRELGRTKESDAVIALLEERARGPEYVSPFALALTYFGKQDLDRGFQYLEKGLDEHDFLTMYMRIGLGGVARDPRYRALVHRVWPEDFPLVQA